MALWRLSSTSGGRSSSAGTRNSTSQRRRTWCTSRNPRTTVTLTPRPGHVVLWVASAVKPPVGWTDVIFCAAGADITLLNVKWWNGVNVNLSGVATWSVRRVSGQRTCISVNEQQTGHRNSRSARDYSWYWHIVKTTCHPIKRVTHIYVKYTSFPPIVKC